LPKIGRPFVQDRRRREHPGHAMDGWPLPAD
jgi:hypothetical protein